MLEVLAMRKRPMPVVYVAGPYRARSRPGVDLNINAARQTGLHCCHKGWSPIIPHANTGGLDEVDPSIPDEFWLEATLELMRRCDAVVLCPGYARSVGTVSEMIEARRLGIPVFTNLDALPDARAWISHGKNSNRATAGET